MSHVIGCEKAQHDKLSRIDIEKPLIAAHLHGQFDQPVIDR